MAPSSTHALLLRKNLILLFGLRLHYFGAFRPLNLGLGNMSSHRIGGSALLLSATSIVDSVVGIAVATPFLRLFLRAIPVRNV